MNNTSAAKLGQKHAPLFALVRDRIREDILNGVYRPGDRLIEGKLSEDLGVSRIPVRAALEGLNARLAAIRRDEATIAVLKDILQRGQDALKREDLNELKQLNKLFHDHLGAMADNSILAELSASFRDRTTVSFAPSNIQRVRSNWEEHAQILNAIIAGNAELANLLASQHVYNAASAYFQTAKQ